MDSMDTDWAEFLNLYFCVFPQISKKKNKKSEENIEPKASFFNA
jgi:hypothetical protein